MKAMMQRMSPCVMQTRKKSCGVPRRIMFWTLDKMQKVRRNVPMSSAVSLVNRQAGFVGVSDLRRGGGAHNNNFRDKQTFQPILHFQVILFLFHVVFGHFRSSQGFAMTMKIWPNHPVGCLDSWFQCRVIIAVFFSDFPGFGQNRISIIRIHFQLYQNVYKRTT